MRLEIQLDFSLLTLPIANQSIVQGSIYASLGDLASFYHDQGYRSGNKAFKGFTFSKFFGKYDLHKESKEMCYQDGFKYYIASFDSLFLETLYMKLKNDQYVTLSRVKVPIKTIHILPQPHFESIMIYQSISPLTIYTTLDDGFTKFFSPFDNQFIPYLENNLKQKYEVFLKKPYTGKLAINVLKVNKSGVYSFKNTTYRGYYISLSIDADVDMQSLLYDVGLGVKNSEGFGMVKIVSKKNMVNL